MRHVTPLIALALLPLVAGCDVKARHGEDGAKMRATADDLSVDANAATVAIRAKDDAVSIDTPGFKGSFSIPGVNLAGDHLDIDGVKLAPGTQVRGVNVDARDGGGAGDRGAVRLSFTNPDAPARLFGHYAEALRGAGYTTTGAIGGALSASKDEGGERKSVTIAATPTPSGSTGTITIKIAGADAG